MLQVLRVQSSDLALIEEASHDASQVPYGAPLETLLDES